MLVLRWILFLVCQILPVVWCQNFYDNDPNIIELTPRNFDKVIHRTNYTSVVEFYAPWCGHCKQLKNTMKKVAKSLDGVVQVATVNCDLAKNKQLCAQHKIEGFPTILIFRPPKIDITTSKPQHLPRTHAFEVYMAKRKLAAIADFALSRMKSYVKKLFGLTKLESILKSSPRKKILLFSSRGDVSPTFKSIALDWLFEFDCFTVQNEKLAPLTDSVELQDSFPEIYKSLQSLIPTQRKSKTSMLVVIDPNDDKMYVYEGESVSKTEIAKFLYEEFEVKPREGPLSERANYLEALKKGDKKKTRAEGKPKSAKKIVNDEL